MKRSSNVVMSKLKSQNSVEPLFERKIEFIRATSAATAFNTTKAPTMTKSGNSSINSTSHMNNRANTDKNVLPQIMTIEATKTLYKITMVNSSPTWFWFNECW
jgi:hypothetical protein